MSSCRTAPAICVLVMLAYCASSASAQQYRPLWSDNVRPPIIAPVGAAVSHYYLEFRARYGPGSTTGHLFTRTVAVLKNGKKKLTTLFGLYAAGGKLAYAATLFGTRGKVGYTSNDLRVRPVERYRIRISGRTHDRLVRAARRLTRRVRWFALFEMNCNYLVGRVARMVGLRAPSNVAQFPDAYLRQLKALNRRR